MFIPPFSGEMTAKIKKLHSKNEMQLFWWERMDSNHRSEDATDLQGKVIIFHVVLFTGVGDSDKIKMSEYVKRGHCIAEIIRETEIGE